MNWLRDTFSISTDKEKLDLPYIHHYLATQSYWAEGIPFDTVKRSVEGSLCFGVYSGEKQIGFARVITDAATFAYLADVFIDIAFRRQGLSKWLIECILSQVQLLGLRRIMLATRDAHELYKKFGFAPLSNPERFMSIHFPDVYIESQSARNK